jgi:hypothetical protein
MASLRSMYRSLLERKAVDTWYRGFAEGYRRGHEETLDFFAERVIQEIHQDAVLSMTADLDTLERIVEIIEAVRDNGETQNG